MSKKHKIEVVKNYLQQGDVFLYPQAMPTNGLKAVTPGPRGFVLADGEVTGHAHVVEAQPDVEFWQDANGTLWMGNKKEVTLKHEEHGHIQVPPGTYRVGRVREVDPMSREIDSVRD